MKTPLTITFLLLIILCFGQRPTSISGIILDENNNPVSNVVIHYGGDTAFSDKQGHFIVSYPNPQQYWYYFYFERKDYLPKSLFVDLSDKDVILKTPVNIRSRKGFWYDPSQIDSTDIGLTVNQVIKKYKLDIDMCLLWDEPPGAYHHFTTELSDSSQACFLFKGIYVTGKRLKMAEILDRKITGIGISFTDGREKIIGQGFTHENPYFREQQMKTDNK